MLSPPFDRARSRSATGVTENNTPLAVTKKGVFVGAGFEATPRVAQSLFQSKEQVPFKYSRHLDAAFDMAFKDRSGSVKDVCRCSFHS